MRNRTIQLAAIDVITVGLCLTLAFLLRFEFSISKEFFPVLSDWVIWFSISQITVFYFIGLYARIWRYTSLFDLYAIIAAVLISTGVSIMYVFFSYGGEGYPRSVLILYLILNMITTTTTRLSVRVYFSHYHENSVFTSTRVKKTLLLIGAGKTGDKIAREILTTHRNQYSIAGFIDDDPQKRSGMLHGKKIFCGIKDLPELKTPYDEI